jgi:signal transduction histidine kinase/ligand-binding sensor domain-containing protein
VKFIAILVTSFLSICALSQRLPLTVYAEKYGPIQNGASKIFQDSKGWMWFLSGYDIIRYDGKEFKIIPLAHDVALEVCFDIFESNNEIGINSQPYHLIVSGDSLRRHPLLNSGDYIGEFFEFNNLRYFTSETGLYRLDNNKPVLLVKHFLKGEGRNVLFRHNDSLLISYYNIGELIVFNIKQNIVYYVPGRVSKIQQLPTGDLYVDFLDKGIVKVLNFEFKGEKCTVQNELFYPLGKRVNGFFLIDKQNNFWVAYSNHYLLRISPDKKTHYYFEKDGLPGLRFNNSFCDREKNVWLAMSNGVCKITETGIRRYTTQDGLMLNYVPELTKSTVASCLYAVTEAGLNFFNGSKWLSITYNGKPFLCNKIADMGASQVSLSDSNVFRIIIDFSTGQIKRKEFLATVPGGAMQLDADSKGTIYISSHTGVYMYYQNKLSPVLQNKSVRSMIIDSHNRLWAGGFGDGLDGYQVVYANKEPEFHKIYYVNNSAQISNELKGIRSIAEDKYGNILAGTRYKGLFYLTIKNDTVVHTERLTMKDGLPSDAIWSVDTDRKNKWWLATVKGLISVSGTAGKRIIRDEGKTYGISKVSEVLCAGDNTVWTDSYPGLAALNNQPARDSLPYKVYITGLSINNVTATDFSTTSLIKLKHTQNNISIRFSANSYINEEAILYSYQLQKNGSALWTEPSAEHLVNFSALGPGTYTFRVKAVNLNGQWSSNEATYDFEILLPYWKRWWFIALVLAVITGILFSLYRYRISQLTKMQAMRNNISSNLHDDIGASLTNILILNEMTKKNIDDKEKATTHISRAGEDIKRISESLSDIVWNISPRYDDLNNLFIRMKRYAAEMLEGKNIEAEISFPEAELKYSMPMDQRRDFYLLFKEVINNMAKHSGANKAQVSIEINNKSLLLIVKDNGKGFTPAKSKTGNGLGSIKQRADKWNALLDINSEPGKGTVISLRMKI